jgi:phytoene dehydrogenase-like protein
MDGLGDGVVDRSVDVVVVGAGVAGLTAAALLAKEGLTVELLEAHRQSGGCAGTFRRGGMTPALACHSSARRAMVPSIR